MRPRMTNLVTGSPLPAWPGEARAGGAFTFDLDAKTLWMARGIREPVTLSQGRFGVLEAVPRILAIQGITAAHGITNFTFHPQPIGRPPGLACLPQRVNN